MVRASGALTLSEVSAKRCTCADRRGPASQTKCNTLFARILFTQIHKKAIAFTFKSSLFMVCSFGWVFWRQTNDLKVNKKFFFWIRFRLFSDKNSEKTFAINECKENKSHCLIIEFKFTINSFNSLRNKCLNN